MNDFEPKYTIKEAVEKLGSLEFVLPIFQRRFVWEDIQIKDLFNTIINNNLFGSMSAIMQTDSQDLLFDYYRDFDKDKIEKTYGQNTLIGRARSFMFIIDGQQRLTSLFYGLYGKIKLFFDVGNCEFHNIKVNENCIIVNTIYEGLKNSSYEEYSRNLFLPNCNNKEENIFKFYYSFFYKKSIYISLVYPNTNVDYGSLKKRFIDLFVKLNTGGTNLTSVDVALCKLKGFIKEFELIVDKVYDLNRQFNHCLLRVFVDSLILFKDKAKLTQTQDDESNEQNESNDNGSEEKMYTLAVNNENHYLPLFTTQDYSDRIKELVYNANVNYAEYDFDIEYIKNNQSSIANVISSVAKLYIVNDNPVYYQSLSIILARLYYASNISVELILTKLKKLKMKLQKKLLMVDLVGIDELIMDNFYTLR